MIDPGTEPTEPATTSGGKHRKIKAVRAAYDRWIGDRDPWVIVPLAALIPAAYLASFVFLTALALRVGWPWWLAWTLPLVVDATVTVAWRIYLVRDRDQFALWVAGAATAASITGNAALHLYATGHGSPGWIVVTLVGAVPALGVGFAVVMEARRRNVEPAPTPAPTEVSVPAASGRVAELAEQIRQDPDLTAMSGNQLARELHVSKTVALAARRVALTEPVPA